MTGAVLAARPTSARPTAAAPLALLLLAMLLVGPLAREPALLNDSHWINYSWSQQFTDAVRHGIPWPRWLPASHGGLGSPTFFFYGPICFWVAALFGLAGLTTWPALVMTAVAASWASGVAMLAYLRPCGPRALAGAAAYMVAPYHLLDFVMRGALAEYCAYASLPLVAIGIRRCGAGRPMLLAAAYASLILTHLPTALLASIFLVPMLVWMEHRGASRPLAWCAVGLAFGLALAAPYLLPAILLQPFASIGLLTWTPALQASHWSLWNADARIRDGLWVIGMVAGGSGVIALGCLRERWSWFILGAVVMALGFVPAIWRVPLLAHVQFPWRMLVLAEFGTAMVVARAGIAPERLLLLCAPALIASLLVLTVRPARHDSVPSIATIERLHPDVIEYLPPGTGEREGAWSASALAVAARMPPARTIDGWTVLRRHAFPIWQVRCGTALAPTRAEPVTGLIRFRGQGCTMERRPTSPEIAGWALACAALSVGALTFVRRSRA